MESKSKSGYCVCMDYADAHAELSSPVIQGIYKMAWAYPDKRPVPRHICHVGGGGVNFTWKNKERKFEWEILPDGAVEYITVEIVPNDGPDTEVCTHGALPADFPHYQYASMFHGLLAWMDFDEIQAIKRQTGTDK